jgi:hypothetical protein
MALDSDGNLAVADELNHRVQVLSVADGSCIRAFGSKGSGPGAADSAPLPIPHLPLPISNILSRTGQFNKPYGLAFDGAHIIVGELGDCQFVREYNNVNTLPQVTIASKFYAMQMVPTSEPSAAKAAHGISSTSHAASQSTAAVTCSCMTLTSTAASRCFA